MPSMTTLILTISISAMAGAAGGYLWARHVWQDRLLEMEEHRQALRRQRLELHRERFQHSTSRIHKPVDVAAVQTDRFNEELEQLRLEMTLLKEDHRLEKQVWDEERARLESEPSGVFGTDIEETEAVILEDVEPSPASEPEVLHGSEDLQERVLPPENEDVPENEGLLEPEVLPENEDLLEPEVLPKNNVLPEPEALPNQEERVEPEVLPEPTASPEAADAPADMPKPEDSSGPIHASDEAALADTEAHFETEQDVIDEVFSSPLVPGPDLAASTDPESSIGNPELDDQPIPSHRTDVFKVPSDIESLFSEDLEESHTHSFGHSEPERISENDPPSVSEETSDEIPTAAATGTIQPAPTSSTSINDPESTSPMDFAIHWPVDQPEPSEPENDTPVAEVPDHPAQPPESEAPGVDIPVFRSLHDMLEASGVDLPSPEASPITIPDTKRPGSPARGGTDLVRSIVGLDSDSFSLLQDLGYANLRRLSQLSPSEMRRLAAVFRIPVDRVEQDWKPTATAHLNLISASDS